LDVPKEDGISPIAVFEALRQNDPAPLSRRITAEAAALRSTDQRALIRQLNGDLEAITSMALAQDPAERYKSVSALAADLSLYLQHRPVKARRPALSYRLGKWVRRKPTILAVPGAMIVAVAVALLFANRKPALTPRTQIPYTTMEGHETNPTFSPDGRKVAFRGCLKSYPPDPCT
jgi:hypothetical protein